MQSVRSRIWTCVAVFISRDDNHYTMGTSIFWYFLLAGTSEFVFNAIIIILLLAVFFFTPAFAVNLSQDAEWQQVSFCLQQASQYSGQYKIAAVWIVSARPWFLTLPVPFSSLLGSLYADQLTLVSPLLSCLTAFFYKFVKFQVLSLCFIFFKFHSLVPQNSKVHSPAASLFLKINYH